MCDTDISFLLMDQDLQEFVRSQAKRFVIEGYCSACYEWITGKKHLCQECYDFTYCSPQCREEDMDGHFDYCKLFIPPDYSPGGVWMSPYRWDPRTTTYARPTCPSDNLRSPDRYTGYVSDEVDEDMPASPIPRMARYFATNVRSPLPRMVPRRLRPRRERAIPPEVFSNNLQRVRYIPVPQTIGRNQALLPESVRDLLSRPPSPETNLRPAISIEGLMNVTRQLEF